VTNYVVPGQLHHYQYRFTFLVQTCTVYLYKFVLVRCIPGSPLPGCVDDVSSVECDVDSLTVIVLVEAVGAVRPMVSASAVYKRPNMIY